MVEPGQTAPDFVGSAVAHGAGTVVELFAEIRRHEAVVLIFQPAAFVPPGTAEFQAVAGAGWADAEDLFLAGLTGDSLYSHAAYADHYGLRFPLVSDFHGAIADSYDLLLSEWEGHSSIPGRATIVIDGDWEIRALETTEPLSTVSPAPVERVTDTLVDIGLSIDKPTVQYDA